VGQFDLIEATGLLPLRLPLLDKRGWHRLSAANDTAFTWGLPAECRCGDSRRRRTDFASRAFGAPTIGRARLSQWRRPTGRQSVLPCLVFVTSILVCFFR
jgi:hypothetical protein